MEDSSRKSRDYHCVIDFEKLFFHNVFRPHENPKPAFLNSVFKNLCFRDGLVWTVGLAVQIKLLIIWQGKSKRSDWFFLGQDFAIRTISMETVIGCVFCMFKNRAAAFLDPIKHVLRDFLTASKTFQ